MEWFLFDLGVIRQSSLLQTRKTPDQMAHVKQKVEEGKEHDTVCGVPGLQSRTGRACPKRPMKACEESGASPLTNRQKQQTDNGQT